MSEDAARRFRLAHWVVPSLGSLLGLTALVNALFVRGGRLFAVDGDVGRHIRVGRTILETGTIPHTDLFSHTMFGAPFVPYEWLSEVITAAADRAFGLAGVALLAALLYFAAVIAMYRASDELGAPQLLAFPVALLGLFLMSVHLLPRPHLFTTAFAGLFVVVLLRFARTGRPWTLAPLPPLMLMWANSHGGFLIGFILLVAFVVGALLRSPEFSTGRTAVKPLLLVLGLCVGASLVNPAGLELWRHTTGYLGIDFLVAQTQEYRSPDFHQMYGKLFFVCLFAGPALWMTGRVRVTPLAAGLFLFFAAAALHSARNLPLFTVAVLPWLPLWAADAMRAGPRTAVVLTRLRDLERTDRLLRPGVSLVAGLALCWLALGPASSGYRFDPDVFPVGAVVGQGRLDTSGHVFNQLTWGGYLLHARPDIPVFIDGQTDFYGEKLSRDYLRILDGRPGWDEVLDRYEIDWTLTERGRPINQLLELDPAWSLSYEDDLTQVYRRSAEPSR